MTIDKIEKEDYVAPQVWCSTFPLGLSLLIGFSGDGDLFDAEDGGELDPYTGE